MLDSLDVTGRIKTAEGRFSLGGKALAGLLGGRGIGHEALEIKARLADVTLPEIDGAPSIEGLDGDFSLQRGTARIAFEKGQIALPKGRKLRVASLDATVSPFDARHPGSARVVLSGPISELAAGLRQIPAADPLRPALDRWGKAGRRNWSLSTAWAWTGSLTSRPPSRVRQ